MVTLPRAARLEIPVSPGVYTMTLFLVANDSCPCCLYCSAHAMADTTASR